MNRKLPLFAKRVAAALVATRTLPLSAEDLLPFVACASVVMLLLVPTVSAASHGAQAAPRHPEPVEGRPSTSYTTQQAFTGRLDYYQSCAECHGGKLDGNFGPALAGGTDNLQFQSVKDVYAYMSAHMPHGNPESLPQEQYVAIMAFLMQSHGIAPGTHPLTLDAIDADTALMGNGK